MHNCWEKIEIRQRELTAWEKWSHAHRQVHSRMDRLWEDFHKACRTIVRWRKKRILFTKNYKLSNFTLKYMQQTAWQREVPNSKYRQSKNQVRIYPNNNEEQIMKKRTYRTGKAASYSKSLICAGYPIEIRRSTTRLKLIDSYWGDLYTGKNMKHTKAWQQRHRHSIHQALWVRLKLSQIFNQNIVNFTKSFASEDF